MFKRISVTYSPEVTFHSLKTILPTYLWFSKMHSADTLV